MKRKVVFKRYDQKQPSLLPPSYDDLVPEGAARIKQRWKVEAVFGNLKHNKGFKRFKPRGLEKVNIETGLMAIAHNNQRFAKTS